MTDIKTKYFTVKEAQNTLPLVKKIVKDILDYTFQMRTIAESISENVEDNDEIQQMAKEVNGFMKELEEIGCYYKDWSFKIGLVDFPAIIDGEEVYLCWRSDEEKILYYHPVSEGYAGRRLIPEEYLKE